MKTGQEKEIARILQQLDQAPLPDKQELLAACPEPIRTQRPPDAPAAKPRGVRWRPRTVCAAVCAAAVLLLAGGQGVRELYRYRAAADLGAERISLNICLRQYSAAEVQQGGEGGVLEKKVDGYALPAEDTDAGCADFEQWSASQEGKKGQEGAVYSDYSLRVDSDLIGTFTSVLEKSVDGQPVWTREFHERYIAGYIEAESAVVVYGNATEESGGAAWVALLDADSGRFLWKEDLQSKAQADKAVIHSAQGTISSVDIFSSGEGFLRLDRYDGEGNLLLSKTSEVAWDGRVEKAVQVGGGYIIQWIDYSGVNEYSRLFWLDGAGMVTGAVQYEADDMYYHITDMVEFEGKLYLSAYAFPIEGNISREINAVLNAFGQEYSNSKEFFQNEESIDKVLTPLTRENYTAVLLVCAPKTGTPQAVYTVDGGIGGGLDLSDAGQLIWNVESLSATSYSPFTSAYTIQGACRVYQAVIGGNGSLKSWKDSGELTAFYR
ncbi:MAG TPA: hypothetical protein H9694_08085 [Firmicutes bacterium]|nr:hypothetical protein [Bacillota bacterium]